MDRPRYLHIAVTGFLAITGDACRDVETGALYIVARKDSYVRLVIARDNDDITVASFLSDTEGEIRFVVPARAGIQTYQAALWLMADLKKRFLYSPRKVSLYNTVSADSLSARGTYIVVGDFASIRSLAKPFGIDARLLFPLEKVAADHGIIFLHTFNDVRILYVMGPTPTGLMKATSAFLLDDMRSMLLGRAVLVKSVNRSFQKEFNPPPYKVSFTQLGYGIVQLQGLGVTRASYRILRQSLGKYPRELVLHLYASIAAIQKGDNALMNVYYNDLLIQSWNIGETGGTMVKKVIELPNYALREENRIEVEFIYFPSGQCKGASFIAHISDISYLEINQSKPPEEGTFQIIPRTLADKTTLVLGTRFSPQLFEAAATLLSVLDRDTRSKYLYPEIIRSSDFKPEILKTSNVIAVVSPSDPMYAKVQKIMPLDPTKTFHIVNTQTGQLMFTLKPEYPLGIIQSFRPIGNTAALFAIPFGRKGDELLKEFTEVLRNNPRLMEGNIGLFGEGGNLYFFNTETKVTEIEYPSEETFLSVLERYKFLIFAVLWVLFTIIVIGVSFYARRQTYKATSA